MTTRHYGLIGFPLSHTRSVGIFSELFQKENLSDTSYDLFPLEKITDLISLIEKDPSLLGLNVTIPFKKEIIDFLHHMDEEAQEIGAVNCISIDRHRRDITLTGHNTDSQAFRETLAPLLRSDHTSALVLGSGGASRAVTHALDHLGVKWVVVSRFPGAGQAGYSELDKVDLGEFSLIINTTPVGMFPRTDLCPDIPYHRLTDRHLLYDLVYNPDMTLFLARGKEAGAMIMNGAAMLRRQAELSWEIWNK